MPRSHSIRSLQMPPRHHDPNAHPFPAAPPSPSLSTTTRASLDFPSRPAVLITRADLRTSISAYEALLASAKAYTSTMLSMAKASSDLACALETCARVKGAHESGPGLQAASGLHFLKSNYQQVLCDTFWKEFSIPLLSHYDTYRSACTDRQVSHDKAVFDKSRELKQAEARNNRAGRNKQRDLNSFRRALAELQSHVDAIDELKAQYYNEVLDAEQEVWQFIESKVALIVRSQIEISERISSKGLNDPVLEQMLSTIPDPFGSYGPPKQDGEIFSILPPISLLNSAANSVHNTTTEAAANDTSVTNADLAFEQARAAVNNATNANAKTKKSVLAPNIMSPSTPSKRLSRGLSSSSTTNPAIGATPTRENNTKLNADLHLASSSTSKASRNPNVGLSAATPKARTAKSTCSLNGPTHLARDSLLGLSAVSEATTAVSTSGGSPHMASGGLFGSESVDFEELLSREQLRKESSSDDDHHGNDNAVDTLNALIISPSPIQTDDVSNNHNAAKDSGWSSDANPTAAGRLRQVLSIIEEDLNGPLSKAAVRMGTASSSRSVSSVYDAGSDPFANRVASRQSAQDEGQGQVGETQEEHGLRLEQETQVSAASNHRRTPSKLSID
ncbi:related to IVY1 - phospholipid-binding protein [Melanopsichium pennsylvanicum]|uniref:Related to IVY1 - phospholipid-binding protein n=2 Tax=Melanopsichium pennsylvanicum TaxID=63383 RepID=A0AAJ4XT40_9BASI|nr:related to IVY1-phospholipid-binding protein [Melanopsichium pennsylvanicum 4]SNX88090.1 related to IVY1 - phospholipid-binding protein [Melanopsichium pennsylvanicum]